MSACHLTHQKENNAARQVPTYTVHLHIQKNNIRNILPKNPPHHTTYRRYETAGLEICPLHKDKKVFLSIFLWFKL